MVLEDELEEEDVLIELLLELESLPPPCINRFKSLAMTAGTPSSISSSVISMMNHSSSLVCFVGVGECCAPIFLPILPCVLRDKIFLGSQRGWFLLLLVKS